MAGRPKGGIVCFKIFFLALASTLFQWTGCQLKKESKKPVSKDTGVALSVTLGASWRDSVTLRIIGFEKGGRVQVFEDSSCQDAVSEEISTTHDSESFEFRPPLKNDRSYFVLYTGAAGGEGECIGPQIVPKVSVASVLKDESIPDCSSFTATGVRILFDSTTFPSSGNLSEGIYVGKSSYGDILLVEKFHGDRELSVTPYMCKDSGIASIQPYTIEDLSLSSPYGVTGSVSHELVSQVIGLLSYTPLESL